jgi:tRNA-binding protein
LASGAQDTRRIQNLEFRIQKASVDGYRPSASVFWILYSGFSTGILEIVLTYTDFDKVDVRVGRIVQVDDFPEARKPAYKLLIDFGAELGVKKSSAQATALYSKEALLGRQVLAVVNFPPKQIGPFMSEVLTLGVPDGTGHVVLVVPEREAPLGGRLF